MLKKFLIIFGTFLTSFSLCLMLIEFESGFNTGLFMFICPIGITILVSGILTSKK